MKREIDTFFLLTIYKPSRHQWANICQKKFNFVIKFAGAYFTSRVENQKTSKKVDVAIVLIVQLHLILPL